MWRPHPRLRAAAWVAVIVLGLFHAAAGRHAIEPDGVSYLDVADRYLSADWRGAINAYWSPLYSWLLGLALLVARPTPYWEYPLVHVVNFLAYVGAFACFEFFLGQLIQGQVQVGSGGALRGGGRVSLPTWAWQLLGYVLFLWAALLLITLSSVTPDMCVAGLALLASGLLVRIRRNPEGWLQFAILGVVLGLGYLAKAIMFPLAFLFLLTCLLSAGRSLRLLSRTLVAASVFLLVSAPFLLALHDVKGRWTFGDSGRLAYAWLVNNPESAYLHWRGKPPGSGTPAHPTTQIFETPPVYEFKGPMRVTYAPWYDPSYWNEGLVARFDPQGQLKVLGRGALRYYAVFINSPIGMATLVGFLALLLCGDRNLRAWITDVHVWNVLLPSIGALGLYALVHVETRYVGPFVIITWLGLFSGIRLRNDAASARVMSAVVLAIAAAGMIVIVAKSIVPAYSTVRDLIRQEDASSAPYWRVADGLAHLGVKPGEEVGFIGYGFAAGSFWARLAKVRIIADIGTGTEFVPKPDVDQFWHAPDDVKGKVIAAFAGTGARAIVANQIPAGQARAGWLRIGATDHFVYFLR
jgi:hypothetical protein